jgi:hypothetical protein
LITFGTIAVAKGGKNSSGFYTKGSKENYFGSLAGMGEI